MYLSSVPVSFLRWLGRKELRMRHITCCVRHVQVTHNHEMHVQCPHALNKQQKLPVKLLLSFEMLVSVSVVGGVRIEQDEGWVNEANDATIVVVAITIASWVVRDPLFVITFVTGWKIDCGRESTGLFLNCLKSVRHREGRVGITSYCHTRPRAATVRQTE